MPLSASCRLCHIECQASSQELQMHLLRQDCIGIQAPERRDLSNLMVIEAVTAGSGLTLFASGVVKLL